MILKNFLLRPYDGVCGSLLSSIGGQLSENSFFGRCVRLQYSTVGQGACSEIGIGLFVVCNDNCKTLKARIGLKPSLCYSNKCGRVSKQKILDVLWSNKCNCRPPTKFKKKKASITIVKIKSF